MNPDIEKAVEAGKLTPAAAATLDRLPPGTYVMHKSWGFGRIDAVNFLLSQVTIDFKGKKAHPMQLQYAAESLQPLPSDHILAIKAADLPALKARVKDEPVGVVRQILHSFGGKATQDQIAQSLVPDVLTEAEFKRWFENTKKALKKDGHFTIPSKKSEPFESREGAVSHADEYLATFRGARRLKDQINALEQILKNVGEFGDSAPAQLQPLIPLINETARKSQRLHTSEALSLLLSRDELIERANGLEKGADAPQVADFLREEERQLPSLLAEVPAVKLKRVLSELPAAFGEEWPSRAITLILRGTTRLVSESARLLVENGHTEAVRTALDRAIREHSITSDALSWLAKERSGTFSDLATVRLLSAILSALERDQFSEKRDRKLHDQLMNDQELLPDLVTDAALEDLRDIMRKLLLSGAFEELNKRSLLGRIIRIHPELQAMVSGETGEKQESLIVSWESLEKRKLEFEELVNKKIPENTKEISIARSYGDLRENFEFKAAKEMQRVLMRRKAETERDLSRARGTAFENPDVAQVSIGTVVALKDPQNGSTEAYSILGAWDGDPDRNIISYQAAIAQAILGKKVGERANVPTEHGDRSVEIASIEAYKK
ncbi:MAG TPA: GreA/GreB family elongation factor [Chthoniobacteraceae bacterium]|jgi:transcription elongation GreA/GreB family factor